MYLFNFGICAWFIKAGVAHPYDLFFVVPALILVVYGCVQEPAAQRRQIFGLRPRPDH
ncbi:MAG: hypothetical protein M3137_04395 [Actinomycetota bacterium]|nr:hypothetical protein [Actinomycetota bacterium]